MPLKMSIRKIYRNAYRYVVSHSFAFAFLTLFYFIGSLLPMIVGSISFALLSAVYMYVFFYFAAGFYYRQQFIWDKQLFIAASMRILVAFLIFLSSLFISTVGINFGIFMIEQLFPTGGEFVVNIILGSIYWLIAKYLFIFGLLIFFFVIPSFTFISEIANNSRSILGAYMKAKGNVRRIAEVMGITLISLLILMLLLNFVPIFIAAIFRASILAFFSIVYFKMYDFLYLFPSTQDKAEKKAEKKSGKSSEKKSSNKNGRKKSAEVSDAEEVQKLLKKEN